jgi:hypothetical protein
MPADLTAARAFVPRLGEALDHMPLPRRARSIYDKGNKEEAQAHEDTRKVALRDLIILIEKSGGKVRVDWTGAAVSLFGLRATATTGLERACRNWMAQVAVKTARERMAAGDSIGAWVPDGAAR